MSKKSKKIVSISDDNQLPYWFDLMYDIKTLDELSEKAERSSKIKIEMEDWIRMGKPRVFKPTGRTM